METLKNAIVEWLKEMLTSGIVSNLTNIFADVNTQVGSIATQVGQNPASFNSGVFGMIRSISETVIMPVAGIILTFIACYELIQMIIGHNNMNQFEPVMIYKWVFKTAISVLIITNTFDIVLGIFDLAQSVIHRSGGLIQSNTAISDLDIAHVLTVLSTMDVGPMIGLWLQSAILQLGMKIMSVLVFIIVYGRMIEIYMTVSLAPLPFATFGNRDWSQIGQNYLKSMIALAFQGFLILICVGIYAVLIQTITVSDDLVSSLWMIMGYTVLLCFTLLKTGGLAKSVFAAH